MSGNNQPQQDAILDVRDLSVSYRTTKAVDGVSLHVTTLTENLPDLLIEIFQS